MSRIIVTGASGFIGRRLVGRLGDAGHAVVSADLETGDVSEESTWLQFPKAEVVVHLAARTFVPDSWVNPFAFVKCNLLGPLAALNYCKQHHARLVYISSYLYGNPDKLPIPETAPLVVQNPYALSKMLAEETCVFYAENFHLSIIILRPFNIYGPGQPDHFLIPSIIRQANSGGAITVKDLKPRRDYVYVDDVVQGILDAVHCRLEFDIFNIGSGVSHSVEDIIRIIQDIKKTRLPVYLKEERRKGEIMDTVADIAKAKERLGWEPKRTLLEGMRETVNQSESHG